MVSITDLWLPILASAVGIFVASSLFWMVINHHKNDWGTLPDEPGLLEAMRKAGVKRGQYGFPSCGGDHKLMNTPEFQEKMKAGPMGLMTVWPNGPPAMGKSMGQWFLYSLIVGIFIAYLGSVTLPFGADYLRVFQVTGTTAVLAYAAALCPAAIWFGRTWRTVFKEVFDGVVYGLITAGCFGALWPGGPGA